VRLRQRNPVRLRQRIPVRLRRLPNPKVDVTEKL